MTPTVWSSSYHLIIIILSPYHHHIVVILILEFPVNRRPLKFLEFAGFPFAVRSPQSLICHFDILYLSYWHFVFVLLIFCTCHIDILYLSYCLYLSHWYFVCLPPSSKTEERKLPICRLFTSSSDHIDDHHHHMIIWLWCWCYDDDK